MTELLTIILGGFLGACVCAMGCMIYRDLTGKEPAASGEAKVNTAAASDKGTWRLPVP